MNATSPARSQRLHQLFSAWVLGLVLATGQAAPAADGDAVLAKILTAPLADAANCPDPLVIWTEAMTAPRVNVAHFLRIDLTDKRIEACVILSADPDGPQGPAEGVLTRPDELMRSTGALALVNANAFAGIASIVDAPGKAGWYAGRAVDIEGLAVSDSIRRSPDAPQRIAFWLDERGKPHLGHPAVSDEVRQAVADWGAPLLVDGRNVAAGEAAQTPAAAAPSSQKALAAPVHPRSMLGFDASGNWLLLAVVDGRQPRYSLGMTLAEGAALMRSHGCTAAINLDGGGSSILLARDASGKPVTLNRPSDGSQRPVPIMIGVRPARSKRP
ncbi:MAG: phosphodiester glycosidase family protein [Verrucomicrobiota bacterium]